MENVLSHGCELQGSTGMRKCVHLKCDKEIYLGQVIIDINVNP